MDIKWQKVCKKTLIQERYRNKTVQPVFLGLKGRLMFALLQHFAPLLIVVLYTALHKWPVCADLDLTKSLCNLKWNFLCLLTLNPLHSVGSQSLVGRQ